MDDDPSMDAVTRQRLKEWCLHWSHLIQTGSVEQWLRLHDVYNSAESSSFEQLQQQSNTVDGLAVLEQTYATICNCASVMRSLRWIITRLTWPQPSLDHEAPGLACAIGSAEAMTQLVLQNDPQGIETQKQQQRYPCLKGPQLGALGPCHHRVVTINARLKRGATSKNVPK
jgi:hypothetical protein